MGEGGGGKGSRGGRRRPARTMMELRSEGSVEREERWLHLMREWSKHRKGGGGYLGVCRFVALRGGGGGGGQEWWGEEQEDEQKNRWVGEKEAADWRSMEVGQKEAGEKDNEGEEEEASSQGRQYNEVSDEQIRSSRPSSAETPPKAPFLGPCGCPRPSQLNMALAVVDALPGAAGHHSSHAQAEQAARRHARRPVGL